MITITIFDIPAGIRPDGNHPGHDCDDDENYEDATYVDDHHEDFEDDEVTMMMTMMKFRAVTRVIRQFPACPLCPMPAATLDHHPDYYLFVTICSYT